MPHLRRTTRWLIALSLLTPLLAAEGGTAVRDRIAAGVEQIRSGSALTLRGSAIASQVVLPAFYEKRAFAPAWSDATTRADLLRAIDDAETDGLNPDDYHRQQLEAVEKAAASEPAARADLDLLCTDALVRLGYHLMLGRVDPAALDPNWNLRGDLVGIDPVAAIEQAIGSGRLHEVIESWKPSHPLYLKLKAAHADYRALAAAGGWEQVPEIKGLEPGASDPRVAALRRRLAVTGDLASTASTSSETYDAELQEAVRAFQRRHGLNDDGVPGARTRAAMNVTAQERVQQIRLNLERARWVLRGLETDFVAVNIAAFRVYVVKNGRPVWNTRAVVGKLSHETPIFRSDLRYIVFNPTWTVPASIARAELLPEMRSNRGYLASKHMVLLDQAGNEVDPATVDLSRNPGFPYAIRQQSGPWNALGAVKFIFPNEHSVFLHDTPSRELFASEVRAFSHGCIRVQDPLKLAEVLLEGQPAWDRKAIDAAIASGETTTVNLEKPLLVLILYWTAWVTPSGELKFYEDVYRRDAKVLRALDQDYARDISAKR